MGQKMFQFEGREKEIKKEMCLKTNGKDNNVKHTLKKREKVGEREEGKDCTI